MGVDRPSEADSASEAEEGRMPPDRPGVEGYPSRAESKRVAAEANKDIKPPSDLAPQPVMDKTAYSLGKSEQHDAGTEQSDAPRKQDGVSDTQATIDTQATVDVTGRDGANAADVEDDHDRPAEGGEFTAISGDGLSEDVALAADLSNPEVETGLLDRIKRISSIPERDDAPREIRGVINRLDYQDPKEDPEAVPDRYGRPLDRADGTRTPLFKGDPTREQVTQGALQDCGIISTLGAVASHRPEAIRNCIRETDDGNYEVRLHETKFSASHLRYEPTGRMITLEITPEIPVFDSQPDRPAFADPGNSGTAWAPILEKSIAGSDRTWSEERRDKWQQRWEVQSGTKEEAPSGYVRLHQGSNHSERAELLTQLTGEPSKVWEFPTGYDSFGRSPDRQVVDEFRSHLAEGKPILVGTRDRRPGEKQLTNNLVDGHAYEVTDVDNEGRIHLWNPWNKKQPYPLTAAQFRANIRPRYSTLE
ncbi:C2 family cysteine protease [Actinoallomurus sp. CA-142502]|uniref:C2 family cysteine protease n=1 Tax=Actinoallomurus sp. CA-142502 TaxID=3239885 RepID=UPI003D8A2054